MANSDTPFGLKPVNAKGSPHIITVNAYYIPATYATNLFKGDPVVKDGTSNTSVVYGYPGVGGDAGTMPEVNKTTAGDGNALTGSIVAFAINPENLSLTYGKASTERVAWVADSVDQLFEIQADGAVPAASIGLNANLIYTHSGDTVYGLSGAELDTTSDPPDTDASNQLTILRLANRPDNTINLTHNKFIVSINQHTEATGAIGV